MIEEDDLKENTKKEKEESKKTQDTLPNSKKESKREETKAVAIEPKKENTTEDMYDEKIEKYYHRQDKMKSLSVLENEIAIMDKIVKFKGEIKADPDFFSNKKDLLDLEIKKLKNSVDLGVMDLDEYKDLINKELIIEKELLKRLNEDKTIDEKKKVFHIKRIQERIDKVNGELSESVPEEPAVIQKEEVAEEKKEVKEEKTETKKKKEEPMVAEVKKEPTNKEKKKRRLKKLIRN